MTLLADRRSLAVKNERKALVLAGGGITGIGWEIGVLAGLADLGVNLADADIMIGTSAGSVVGAQLRAGIPIEDLYATQLLDAGGETVERLGRKVIFKYVLANLLPGGDQAARARLGKLALAARTAPEAERKAVFEQLLPFGHWPERPLLITAVDAESGELKVFDRDSGVSLVDAVSASCAVPLIWPPMTIDGHRYMDGGMRSIANLDLAKGYGRVVVLAPITTALRRSGRISEQLAGLGKHLHSAVVSPDAEARGAIGRNVLDPAHRAASAMAGRAQARSIRDTVAVAWGSPPA
jgi:NTE family protein